MSITEILASKFNGNKTYITAIVTILTSLAAYFAGDMTLFHTVQLIVPALLGAFLRHGISTEVASAITMIATDITTKK